MAAVTPRVPGLHRESSSIHDLKAKGMTMADYPNIAKALIINLLGTSPEQSMCR